MKNVDNGNEDTENDVEANYVAGALTVRYETEQTLNVVIRSSPLIDC